MGTLLHWLQFTTVTDLIEYYYQLGNNAISPATPGPCIINISSVQSKDEKRLVTVSKNKTTPTHPMTTTAGQWLNMVEYGVI